MRHQLLQMSLPYQTLNLQPERIQFFAFEIDLCCVLTVVAMATKNETVGSLLDIQTGGPNATSKVLVAEEHVVVEDVVVAELRMHRLMLLVRTRLCFLTSHKTNGEFSLN